MPRFNPNLLRRVGRFFGLLSATAALLGAAFLLTYRWMDLQILSAQVDLVHVLQRLYAATLAIASPAVWWIVLSLEQHEQSHQELLESMHHLEQTRQNLVESEKLASLGGLVAGVAHEINTPVGISVSIASYLSDRTEAVRNLAQAGQFDRSVLDRYLQDADASARLLLSNARRVAQLITNFKKLSVDRISEPRLSFDLRELLVQTVSELQPKVEERGVDVTVDVATGIEIESYPVALAQVVTNLIINSLQHAFSPEAPVGSIVIRARLSDGGEVQMDFSDNGAGIAIALRGRVFEPFYTTRRTLGGSGLGLYIVNQIVTRQLDGSIVFDEAAHAGTCFVIRFPRIARHAPDVSRSLAVISGAPPRDR